MAAERTKVSVYLSQGMWVARDAARKLIGTPCSGLSTLRKQLAQEGYSREDIEVTPPRAARLAVNAYKRSRSAAEQLPQQVRAAVTALQESGLTVRDSADVMGISYQRLHEIRAKDAATSR